MNREEMLRKQKAQYDANPEAFHQKNRLGYQRHRASRLQQMRQYQKQHAEEIKSKNKEYRNANKALIASKDKLYRIKNAERVKSKCKEWREKNKSRVRANILKRKALKKSATVNLAGINDWMKKVLSKPLARCYYCDKMISTKRIHVEHIVPLVEGGLHAIENLCVSCAPCNLAKGYKPITVWAKPGQQILAL